MIQNPSSVFHGLMEYDSIALNLRNLVFFFCMLYLSVEDLKRYRIPDKCLGISVIAWCMAIPFAYQDYGGWSGIAVHLLAAVVYGGGVLILSILIEQIFKKESLGGGDVKLIAVMGLYLGMNLSLYALFFACNSIWTGSCGSNHVDGFVGTGSVTHLFGNGTEDFAEQRCVSPVYDYICRVVCDLSE